MIVSFFARGSGGGSGPVDYLLGKDRKREQAELLRGEPDETVALIDSSNYSKKYTSGVLSFEETNITDEQKRQIMASFEDCLFPGMDKDQYNVLWVEHTDKGRLELNFVIPNIELTTGKRLQPYYHAADLPRVDAWQTIQNIEHGLTDANDPSKRQTLVLAKDLPRNKQEAARAIDDGIYTLAKAGAIKSREDVIEVLENAGFEVARQTKTSISVKDPDGGRNIRLKGVVYEQGFRASKELRSEIGARSREFRESAGDRLKEARERYQSGINGKRLEIARRYSRAKPSIERRDRSEQQSLAESDLRQSNANEHEPVQIVANSDHRANSSVGSAISLERLARRFSSEKTGRNQSIKSDDSDIGERGRKDTIQQLRRERNIDEIMRPDRRESTDLSGRLQNSERVLEDDRSGEAAFRYVAQYKRDERERTEKFNNAVGELGKQAEQTNEDITTLERAVDASRKPTRTDQLIDRAKSTLSRAFRAAEQLFKQMMKREAQRQQEKQEESLKQRFKSTLEQTKEERQGERESRSESKGMSR